jgi:hypothetical protein
VPPEDDSEEQQSDHIREPDAAGIRPPERGAQPAIAAAEAARSTVKACRGRGSSSCCPSGEQRLREEQARGTTTALRRRSGQARQLLSAV